MIPDLASAARHEAAHATVLMAYGATFYDVKLIEHPDGSVSGEVADTSAPLDVGLTALVAGAVMDSAAEQQLPLPILDRAQVLTHLMTAACCSDDLRQAVEAAGELNLGHSIADKVIETAIAVLSIHRRVGMTLTLALLDAPEYRGPDGQWWRRVRRRDNGTWGGPWESALDCWEHPAESVEEFRLHREIGMLPERPAVGTVEAPVPQPLSHAGPIAARLQAAARKVVTA